MKTGFTLIELMIVMLTFTFLFGTTLAVLSTSDLSWRQGQDKLTEQQEARRAMDDIAGLLRQTKPEWVTISPSDFPDKDKILLYEPVINEETGEISPGNWVIYKPDPADSNRLIKKVEGGDWNTITQHLESIRFNGGDCVGCSCDFTNPGCSNCITVTNNCPLIKIQIETKKKGGFVLSSYAELRNSISGGEAPEPPAEGEF